MKCNRCGKENPAEIHTCTPNQTHDEALRLADALDATHPAVWPYGQEAAAILRRLHAENEALQKALRRVIRTYRVADDAWDPDAETERLYQREIEK